MQDEFKILRGEVNGKALYCRVPIQKTLKYRFWETGLIRDIFSFEDFCEMFEVDSESGVFETM
jgi:hypothetical protein